MASNFLLLVSISLALLLSNCKGDLISNICSQSSIPSECEDALRDDPHGADPRALGLIAIEKAQAAAQASANVARSLATSGNKGKIDTCIKNLKDAEDNLSDCKNLIYAQDRPRIGTLQTRASAALADVATCDHEFGAAEPPQLKKATLGAYEFIKILLVISKLL